ncbi:hypothetical protein ACFYUY_34975 [Kitasatospora sp. NPDC004745]|uniref:hypothetical protein n=1 Tax=Kitasatospora sp. NPDC004745 TaxID=3364019 RepID=UPI0036A52A7F
MSTTYESPPPPAPPAAVNGSNRPLNTLSLPRQDRTAGTPAGAVRHVVTRQEYQAAKKALHKLERLGELITRSLMTIGGGALVFTCVNVTLFAMSHDIPGWIAWMLDPLASLALITVLYVDGVLTEQGGERAKGWPFLLRWFAGLSTWSMNAWTSLYPDGVFYLVPQHPDAGGLLLHSVAPFLLIGLAEASSGYRAYLARRLEKLRQVIQDYEDQEQAAKKEREDQVRAERERAEAERAEAVRAEREARKLREDREYEERREREQVAAMAEQAERASKAEIERLREQARLEAEKAEREERKLREAREFEAQQLLREKELEETRAKIEAEQVRREREAEIERIREQRELENARTLREAEQARIARENEDARARREQENEAEKLRQVRESEDARQRSAAEREALRIKAEGEAKAKILLAEEQVRQQQAAEQERREKEAAEAADKRRKAEERAAARQQRLASQTARTPRTGSSRVPSEIAPQNGGTVPRELRSQLREQAEREVARLMLEGSEIDQKAIGERYGKGETWVGDRVRNAKKRLANDSEFENEVITSALEDEMPVSEEARDSDTQAGDEAA